MRSRTRTLAGLLGLFAMTASFSETVVASMCAAPSNMASMAMSAADDTEARDAGGHEHSCAGMGNTDESKEGGERCPLTPTATQGCTAAALVPSPAIALGLAMPLSAREIASDAIEPDLLLSYALYHPPRA